MRFAFDFSMRYAYILAVATQPPLRTTGLTAANDLLQQDPRELDQEGLEELTNEVNRAFIRLSCKERSTSRQQQVIGQLFSLRARCLAEHKARKQRHPANAAEPIVSADPSVSSKSHSDITRFGSAETTRALGWHSRLFDDS